MASLTVANFNHVSLLGFSSVYKSECFFVFLSYPFYEVFLVTLLILKTIPSESPIRDILFVSCTWPLNFFVLFFNIFLSSIIGHLWESFQIFEEDYVLLFRIRWFLVSVPMVLNTSFYIEQPFPLDFLAQLASFTFYIHYHKERCVSFLLHLFYLG